MDRTEKSYHEVVYSHASRLTSDGHFTLELDGFPLKGVKRVDVSDGAAEPITVVIELVVDSVNTPSSTGAEASAQRVDELFDSLYLRCLAPLLERLEHRLTPPR